MAGLRGQFGCKLNFADERTEPQRDNVGAQEHPVGKQTWGSRPCLLKRKEEAAEWGQRQYGQLCGDRSRTVLSVSYVTNYHKHSV